MAASCGGTRPPGPHGPSPPRPAARPLTARPGPQPGLHPRFKRSCGNGPRSPPPCLPKRWPGRPGRQRRRGASAAPGVEGSRGASRLPARAGDPSPAPSRPHSPRGGSEATYFWAADLPTPCGGNEGCHGVTPRSPLASRTFEAPLRSREGGCAPARVRPVALSSSSFHYIIFFSEGWAGAGGLGRKETFANFLHSPHPQSALKKQC